MDKPTIYRVLRDAHNARKEENKVKILRENSSPALKAVLGYALDPRVVWKLPEGVAPYTENHDRDNVPRFAALTDKLAYFVDGPLLIKNVAKRENFFLNMLSDIDPGDAMVLVAMKEKKLPFDSITREIVEQAFPNMTKDWPKETEK